MDASSVDIIALEKARGSVHSIGRGSVDMRSISSHDAIRRSSAAKLNALPLEAPITKVLELNENKKSTSKVINNTSIGDWISGRSSRNSRKYSGSAATG